jgi:peptidoglycan/LPS O-acetylase OafA/YrhL
MINLQKNDSYFKALTGVRAIAAFMVYLHHFNPIPKQYAGTSLYNFIQEMHVGVTLFFVLSGFLIAYRHSDMADFSFRKYMVNRVAKIYPMYFILTTLTFIALSFKTSDTLTKYFVTYLLNISFLRGFFEQFKFSGIAQGWSLTAEEIFYILAPFFFLLLKRSRLYLVILPACIISFGIGLVMIFSKVNFHGFFSSFEFLFNYTFLGRCSEFFIGVALALIFKHGLIKTNFRYFTYVGFIGIGLCIYLISLCKGNNDFGIRHPVGKLINTFMLPLLGILPFYYGLLKEKTFISKILSSNLFELLGRSSYTFYLIHMGIFSIVLHKITTSYILIFLVLNIMSILLYKYIEEPLNTTIRAKFSGRISAPVNRKTVF